MPLRTTHAHILSLNGTPVHSHIPAPFLRRTGSGRLFEPEQLVIKTCEKGPPVPVDEEDVDYGHVSRGRDVDVDDVVVDRMEAMDEEGVGMGVTVLERVRALAVVHGMPFSGGGCVEVGEVKGGKGRVVERGEREKTEIEMLCKRAGTY